MAFKINVSVKNLDVARAKIRTWPTDVADKVYFPALKEIADNGREYIRYTILASSTKTGEERASAGGGSSGRYVSGTLFDQVRSRVNTNKDSFTALVGWTDGTPEYAIFQEYGTRTIEGMNSIVMAREYMLSAIQGLNGTGRVESPSFGGFSN